MTSKGRLSTCEKEVLRLLSEGKSNAEIGCEMGISINTVKTHTQNLFEKLGVRNRTEAAGVYLTQELPAPREL